MRTLDVGLGTTTTDPSGPARFLSSEESRSRDTGSEEERGREEGVSRPRSEDLAWL